jgi:hypothetical protein
MTEVIEAGWHPDPLGRHEQRYHDGTSWTEHVSDGTPGPTAGTAPAVSRMAVPGTASVVTLPDSAEQEHRRRLWGMAMIGVAAALLVTGAPTWVSGSGSDATSLSGYELGAGGTLAFLGVLLGLYGLQALKRPRVRYHVGALLIVVTGVISVFGAYATLSDEQVLELAGESQASASPDIQFGPVGIEFGPNPADEAREELQTGIGLQLALAVQLAALVPLIALWREDRQRRRDAGLLL